MDLLDLQSDPAAFRAALLIDTDAGPRPLAECMAGNDWQATDFAALDGGWQRAVVGSTQEATYQRGWLERPRGHSKSLDLGIMAAWALFASRRRLSGIGAAGDQDQARLLRDAISKLVYCNPWLSKIIEVQAYKVINVRTESTLEIIASDAATSYGLTPDFVIADEVVHWKKRDLWDSLISSAAKRSTCMFVVITNAGLEGDFAWELREAVRSDPTWYFRRLDGPCATWITPDRLAEQERLLPSISFNRLWLNTWGSGLGDALSIEVVRAAFHPDRQPQSHAAHGYEYVGGLDLGVSRDASAVCILGIRRGREGHGMIRCAHIRVWRPTKGQRVNLQDVEDTLSDLHGRFNLRALNYDPWQAQHLASRLQAGGLSVYRNQLGHHHQTSRAPMVEVAQSGPNLQRMASTLIEAFNDHRVELFEHADIRRDITRFRIEEKPYGFRLVSPKDQHGHGDVGSAFCLALLAASELAAKRKLVAGVAASDLERTPWQKAQAQFAREAEEYARRQEQLQREHVTGEHARGLADAMRQNRPL